MARNNKNNGQAMTMHLRMMLREEMFRRARLQPLSSSSSSSLPRDDVQDVHRADIRRNRRKTTVIGDNRFRPAWNKRQRGTKEWREKEARPTKEKKERKKEPTRIILRRVLK